MNFKDFKFKNVLAILNKPYMVIFHVLYYFHHFIHLSQVDV